MAHKLEHLLPYCNTAAQRRVVELFMEGCSGPEIAETMKMGHRSGPDSMLRRVKKRAARDGFAPGHFEHGVAPGFSMRKVTVQRNASGDVERTWERQHQDDGAREEAFREAIEGLRDELPRERIIAGPISYDDHLLNLFTLTDCHVGMMAWSKETLDSNWDLKIAEDTLVEAFRQMITRSPPAKAAIINQLGDFLHFDGLDAVTPTNKHLVDVDGRFRKISRVAVRILRRVINMALETHGHVHVVCAEGNHDIDSSNWLGMALEIAYENNPRVTIEDCPLPFYRYRHGNTLLGFHHGHTKRRESLPLLFAQLFRPEWGDTQHTYIHTGHRHHIDEKDDHGVVLVQHPTLAARDAYAARHGYLAARQASAITYHDQFGEWGRATVTPAMLGIAA